MKPILVTCVYHSRSDWLVGGKDNDEGLYVSSLKNLSKLNMPMHLYCWPHEVKRLEELIKPFFKEFKVIGCNLFDYPRSYEILETKNNFVWFHREHAGKKDYWMYAPRNELLCHWKLKWCSMARDNEWGCDKVFWMDAGVTEWCKVPLSLGGAEYVYPHEHENKYPDSHYWPENKNNIFNEKITDGVKRIFNDKEWFFITQNQQNDRLAEYDWERYGKRTNKIISKVMNWPILGKHYDDPDKLVFDLKGVKGFDQDPFYLDYPAWTVGTFFGGSFDILDNVLIPKYDELFNEFTNDHNILPFTEEPYYSILAFEHKYNLFWFDNWNHGRENEPCFHQECSKPFYTTLLDVINYQSD